MLPLRSISSAASAGTGSPSKRNRFIRGIFEHGHVELAGEIEQRAAVCRGVSVSPDGLAKSDTT